MVVHHDALLLVQRQTQGCRVDAAEIGPAAGGHEDLLAVSRAFLAICLVDGPQERTVLLHPQHLGAGEQADAQLLQLLEAMRTASFCSRGISSGIISTTVTSVP